MKAIIDIEQVTKLLSENIDPYEIPGAIDAVIESLIELKFVEEEHYEDH